VARLIEERLASFQVLLPEFVLLFCRLCGQSIEKPGEVTVHELATLMVLRAHLLQQLQTARNSGQISSVEHESDHKFANYTHNPGSDQRAAGNLY
jgi:hypothetical protein